MAKYFDDSLPTKANHVFQEAEDGAARILVPEIVIGEFVYIALKGRLESRDPSALIAELLDELSVSAFLQQVSISKAAWQGLLQSDIPELHDRMIHAIAEAESAEAIITNDAQLRASGFRTIW